MNGQEGSTANKHILVVDDDIELVLTYQALLQTHGYQASTAGNGSEALRVVKNGKVDAILCDLDMPELSGDLFYIEVGRTWPQLLKRFIFITGNTENPTYASFLKRTEVPVLAKPVSIDRLLDQLQTVLGIEAKASV